MIKLRLIFILATLILTFTHPAFASEPNFDWLLGQWKRVNDKASQTTYENWTKKSASEYVGQSYTVKDDKRIWQEDVLLVNRDGVWSFNVTMLGEITPTTFIVKYIEEGSFWCENPNNPFPTKIEYKKQGDALEATIYGNGQSIDFNFEKYVP